MVGTEGAGEQDNCAWCKEPLTTIEVGGHVTDGLSSGVCIRCAQHFQFQKGVDLRNYLDNLPLPVLVVDQNVVVKMANRAARKRLGKELGQLEQVSGGQVFECAHARQPGGCGGSVHCSGCTIRWAVVRTWESGEPQNAVPATLRPTGPGEQPLIEMTISTYKADDRVMLRVDRFVPGGAAGTP